MWHSPCCSQHLCLQIADAYVSLQWAMSMPTRGAMSSSPVVSCRTTMAACLLPVPTSWRASAAKVLSSGKPCPSPSRGAEPTYSFPVCSDQLNQHYNLHSPVSVSKRMEMVSNT